MANYRFAQSLPTPSCAPQTLETRIAEIPGVAQVQTRVVANVKVDVPGTDRASHCQARVCAGNFSAFVLNQLHLRKGRYIETGRPGEVLISEGFAGVHGLVPAVIMFVPLSMADCEN